MQGTGLGLAITAKVVEMMGGTISVKSKVGEGSEFTVVLEMDELQERREEADRAPVEADLSGRRVLLVEDNEINAEIAVMILSQYGLLTERAKDGQEGFEKVRTSGEGYYDAVLMDIQMPVMNGYEASSAIRAMEGSYFKHVPIIAMSANAYDEDVRDSLRSGMNAHIAKPYQPEDLMHHSILACDYDLDDLHVYEMNLNHNTTPVVATIDVKSFDDLRLPNEEFPKEAPLFHKTCERLDDEFLTIMQKVCEDRIVSTVFLLGDGFKEKWPKRSLEFLCRTRRVFQGNNMFSKGASIAARERINPSDNSKKYVFLGEDKLKSNLGMKLLKCGTEVYYALLDAGANWYEAGAQLEIIMDPSGILNIEVTPLTGKMPKMVQLYLDGLEKRPEGTTRLRITLFMNSVSEVAVKVQDLGFGELFPSTGKVWEQVIEL